MRQVRKVHQASVKDSPTRECPWMYTVLEGLVTLPDMAEIEYQ
jgi:hypothetical protein